MKRNLHLLLITGLLLASCGENSPEKEVSTEEKSGTTTEQETDSTENTPEQSWDYYAGTVGLYGEDVIVELSVNEGQISGGYWYLKHGKRLALTGEISPKQNEWKLTESYKGKTTGTFQLEERNDSLIGIWYAQKAGSEPERVALRKLVNDTDTQIDPTFEDYQMKHKIDMYNWETEEIEMEDASDDMRLTRVGDYVIFSYEVIGANAHMGFINGIAKMSGKDKAIFRGEEDCELTIQFEQNSVVIEESDCHYYRGMRAYFGGRLERVR